MKIEIYSYEDIEARANEAFESKTALISILDSIIMYRSYRTHLIIYCD